MQPDRHGSVVSWCQFLKRNQHPNRQRNLVPLVDIIQHVEIYKPQGVDQRNSLL